MTKSSRLWQPIKFADCKLKDGLPYSENYADSYCSDISAIKEKTHVFIDGNQLKQRFATSNSDFIIGELGFGLGINFLLSWQHWLQYHTCNHSLHYIATEAHPIPKAQLATFLSPFTELSPLIKKFLDNYPILTPGIHYIKLTKVNLILLIGDSEQLLSEFLITKDLATHQQLKKYSVDAWFLDGFSPSKNAAQWQASLMSVIAAHSKSSTTVSTYSVAGLIKRTLTEAGFTIKKKAGIGRKKSYLSAYNCQNSFINNRPTSGFANIPWHSCNKSLKPKSVAIIGGGFAGCLLANRLSSQNIDVSLFEKNEDIALTASGNARALVHFMFSAFHSPLNDFLLSAFLYAVRFYKQFPNLANQYGVAELLDETRFKEKQLLLADFANAYSDLFQFKTAVALSDLAGIKIIKPGIFWPHALIISPREICQQLLQDLPINVYKSTSVEQLNFDEGRAQWQVDGKYFDSVVIANGIDALQFSQSQWLQLEKAPGVVSQFKQSGNSQQLKIALIDNHYLTPSNHDGMHIVGGEFGMKNSSDALKDAHQKHKQSAQSFLKKIDDDDIYRYCIRAKTYDYLPLVGSLPNETLFSAQYQPLQQDKNRLILDAPPNLPGLFTLTGFGAHGFATIPLAVEMLLSQMLSTPSPTNESTLKHLNPARVLIKALTSPNLRS